MAELTELVVSKREVLGKKAKRLRKAGLIPGNIFGHRQDSVAVQVDEVAFDTLRRQHKTTGIMSLRLDGSGTETALVRHIQRDPRTNKIVHIDFFRVSLTERITVRIPLHVTGEAPAVKNEGGVLLHLVDALEVECTAQDIVDHLDVDVSSLDHIDDTIHAKDVALPANYTLLTDPDEPVVKVGATRAEVAEEEAAAEETPAAPAPEAAAGENAEG
jgi:large subunit ribosomal protein L25